MNANTAWQQIGIMTKMVIGARNPVYGDDYLRFEVLKRKSGWIYKITIRLNHLDLYDVEYRRIRYGLRANSASGVQEEVLGHFDDVYFDSLDDVIYGLTHRGETQTT